MHKISMLIVFIGVTVFSSCHAQNNQEVKKNDRLKLKVRILHVLPIGWGYKYNAAIEKVVEGDASDFTDTIEFGVTASQDYKVMTVGELYTLTMLNSKEISPTPYLPIITGMVSKRKEIWNITSFN